VLWSGFRSRLFLVSVFLVVVSASASSLWLRSAVRPLLREQAESWLLQQARTCGESLRSASAAESLDARADRLGLAAAGRVTIIDAGGTVLGDSHVEADQLGALENHAARPEVAGALVAPEGWAASQRRSATVGEEMLYVAVRADAADRQGLVLRVARPIDEVDAPLQRLYRLILVAALLGLVVSGFMTVLASGLMSRDLRRLMEHTTELARGAARAPLELSGPLELTGIAGSVHALSSELQRTVRSLAAERTQLEAILDSLSEGILAVGGDGRIVQLNPAAVRMLGCSPSDRAQPVETVFADDELLGLIQGVQEGRPKELSLERTVAEEPRLLRVRAQRRPSGAVVVVVRDVTNLHRLETIRRDFVANVSHELRTPVSVVQASAEALQDGALEDEQTAVRFVDAILRNTERLGLLITDLLSLSRIEAGRYHFDFEALELRDVVADVLEALTLRTRARNHEVTVRLDPQLRVRGDAGALEQVLVNLLENATKYTPDGGTIELREAEAPPGRVRIEVADNGPGIDPAHHRRIFERFYRVDTGRSRAVGGTGLGLAIVKHLCESMGGAVGVRSNTPHGSVFWVDLPAAPADAEPA
jgi:two-component system phosphate regulon sensor histidine kinase PhoR